MYQFIETICFEQGAFQRIDLHNMRCNQTRNRFFGSLPPLDLALFLSVPDHLKEEKIKCTVTYDEEIRTIEYVSYQIRPVNSLKMVYDDTIDYSFKYADRTKLSSFFQLRGQFDDILIIKNGLITDTCYANIIFFSNSKWYSPKKPLLHGTRVESYIREKRVTSALLRPKDLSQFSEARIINAMISIEDAPIIPISHIRI
jgi:4-amino-4-deoxychorismate lyase